VWGPGVVHVREFGVVHEEDMQKVGVVIVAEGDAIRGDGSLRDRRENWKCCDS
jgi:hypothetical protein